MDDFPCDNEKLLPAIWLAREVEPEPDPQAGRRAAIYARYSYLGQRESSIERQTEVCTNYIQTNNYILVGTYADRARTGTKVVGREDLQRCLEDAAARKFDILVVEDIDRLGRALEVTVDIWKQLKALKIDIHDSEIGRLTAGQIGSKGGASDEERTKLLKRNRQGQRRKARAGGWIGGACFGYKCELINGGKSSKTVYVKDPDESKIVLEIFELYDKGVSPDRIAKILNARPAAKRGNRFWTGHELRGSRKYKNGLLRRLRYTGVSTHGLRTVTKDDKGIRKVTVNLKTVATGKLDKKLGIVSRPLFERVQERLDRDIRGPREPYWTVASYPLRKKLFCACCGGQMTPTLKRADGHPRAMCNRARNPLSVRPGSKSCDNMRSTSTDQLDDMIIEVLRRELCHPAAFTELVSEYNAERKMLVADDGQELAGLQVKLKTLKAERDDVWNARRSFGDEFVDQKASELKEQIEQAAARIEELKDAASEIQLKQFDGDSMKALADGIGEVFSPDFDKMDATGTSMLATLRKLVHKVVVDVTEDSTEVEVQCNLAAVLEKGNSAEILRFRLRRERTGHAPLHSELQRIDAVVAAKTHAMSDRAWEKIAPLLPGCVARSKRGTYPVEMRSVVDAALLHLNEEVPLKRMPAAFGEREAVFEGLRRLSSSGAWDMVVHMLRKIEPMLIPATSTNMFSTVVGRYSTSLKGLPEIRVRHGVEIASGKHAITEADWDLISELVPEQVLMVHKEPARITPRDFLTGVLYMLKSGVPISNMPLQMGSQTYLSGCIKRLVYHGFWDRIVEKLSAASPATLEGAELDRFNIYPRSATKRTAWRGALAKRADNLGIPGHFPTDAEWNAIKHLFPIELLYVDEKLAVDNPRRLAHALLYRVKEKIPIAAFPAYFGDKQLLQLTFTKFAFHYLWDETVAILQESFPDTLKGADLEVFSKYRKARTRRYAHLLPAVELEVPKHAPCDAHWELVKDLIPETLLVIRGKPAIMEPRQFLHALLFMASERVLFGGLPKHYFGSADDIKFATRKLVRHHLWDEIVGRLAHFDEEFTATLDTTIFDKLPRSANEKPEFRKHRARRTNKLAYTAVAGDVDEALVFGSEALSSGDGNWTNRNTTLG